MVRFRLLRNVFFLLVGGLVGEVVVAGAGLLPGDIVDEKRSKYYNTREDNKTLAITRDC